MKSACVMLLFFQVITYIPNEAAEYVGGTVTTIPQEAVGELITADENILSFTWQKAGQSGGGEWRIPYNRVTYLGYGQHAGRRVGTATALAPASVMIRACVLSRNVVQEAPALYHPCVQGRPGQGTDRHLFAGQEGHPNAPEDPRSEDRGKTSIRGRRGKEGGQ